MVAAGRALDGGDNSDIDEVLDEFFNEEAEAIPGLCPAACNSTDFYSATGVDSYGDFLCDGVGIFSTDEYYIPTTSVLQTPMNYSAMVGAPQSVEPHSRLIFSGDPIYLDDVGCGPEVGDDEEWVSSIFDETCFPGENIQKIPAIAGVDEDSDSRSQAARSEMSHPELGSSKPAGSKRSHDDQSPVSTLDWQLGVPSGAAAMASFSVRSENCEAAKTMTMLKKKKTARAEAAAASDGRKCLHCQTDKTPQWRTGPGGPKTLCNACGMRFKSGRLVPEYRPASSPSFVGSHHSNSHRKVLELRRQKSILDLEQEQRRQLFGTCSLGSVLGLPTAMRPLDALFHGLGSGRQFGSSEE